MSILKDLKTILEGRGASDGVDLVTREALSIAKKKGMTSKVRMSDVQVGSVRFVCGKFDVDVEYQPHGDGYIISWGAEHVMYENDMYKTARKLSVLESWSAKMTAKWKSDFEKHIIDLDTIQKDLSTFLKVLDSMIASGRVAEIMDNA
jgi:hypothetical protein